MLVFHNRSLDSIKAIIFDMDGTLIDSMGVYFDIMRDIVHGFGMEMFITRELLFERLSQGDKMSDILFPGHLEERETIVRRFRTLAIRAFRDVFSRGEVDLVDGVDALLEELRRKGFLLAIVTSSMADVIIPFLEARDLRPHLSCVLGRDEVSRLKPYPDPLLKCVELLSVDPCESVYVGDSIIDIRAGKAAGTGTVGVLTGATDLARLKAEAPDAILDSVMDLPTIL